MTPGCGFDGLMLLLAQDGGGGGGNSITLIGDVTGSGSGTIPTTISPNAVNNSKLAKMPALTIKGNNTGVLADALDLTGTQVTAMLDVMTGDLGAGGLKGLVPPQVIGDSAKFLRGDGTWQPVGGGSGGTVTSVSVVTANGVSGSVANPTTTPAITLTLGNITPNSVQTMGVLPSAIQLGLDSTVGALRSKGQVIARRTFTTATDTVLANDHVVAYNGVAQPVIVTLPLASSVLTGTVFFIKDEGGNSIGANRILVNRSGADLIDGATSVSITARYGVLRVYSNGTGRWLTI